MSLDFDSLQDIAQALTIKGKGILAADESNPTCKKRFDSIDVDSTEQNRNIYRDMLFTTKGMEDFISGVILFDETIRQSTIKGEVSFPDFLSELGVIPGIKVDAGAKHLSGTDNEKVTEGLDGLDDRLKEYYSLGARFAKWRAVITISDSEPSGTCISANAHALARYASLCQKNGIVPIVEPEILMDGDHPIEDSFFDGLRPSTEEYAIRLAQAIQNHLGSDYAISESGASGPSGNRYGDSSGHCCIAVASIDDVKCITIETGSEDRAENMNIFAKSALSLLQEILQ